MRIVELNRNQALEFCANQGLRDSILDNANINSYLGILEQKIIGIIVGCKSNNGIVIFQIISNLPKESFADVIAKQIYTWKQCGIIVESRIEGFAFGQKDMLLPVSIDKVLKAIHGQV